jgi:tRNA (guanine-N7-)-methyltransferase
VSQLLCENSVDEFHIYHPQPYADPSQQGQRMLTAQFLAGLHSRLKLGGRVYLQSDRQAYWNYIQQAFAAMFEWYPVLQSWPEDPNGRSRREILSVAQGLPIFRGFAVKTTQLDDSSLQTIALSMPEPNFQMPKPIKRNRPWRRRSASARKRRS